MKSLGEVVDQVVAEARRPVAHDMDFAKSNINHLLTYYLDGVFKLLKNINETSISPRDRAERISKLAKDYGIPKTYLL